MNFSFKYIFNKNLFPLICLFFCGNLMSSCRLYNQNILFKSNGDLISDKALLAKMAAEQSYLIQHFDRLQFRVFSNEGQEIKWIAGLEGTNGGINTGTIGTNTTTPTNPQTGNAGNVGATGAMGAGSFTSFTLQPDGKVYLPMVGDVELYGKTARQADSILSIKFNKFYNGSYVRTQFLNKRVIVLKGGVGQVVPLFNENTTLIEILAQTGGVPNDIRAKNIRLIRGDLENPNVFVIDLSTIEGMKRVNLLLKPNDIVYLEPVRKTFLESLSDASSVVGVFANIATVLLTLIILSR
jgi:polysaccharide biosynthesis/export protein